MSASVDEAVCAVEDLFVRFDTTDAWPVSTSPSSAERSLAYSAQRRRQDHDAARAHDAAKPTSGRAFVMGHDVRREGIRVRSQIGYIPQAISVDAALTGAENLEFYARVTGVPRSKRRARIGRRDRDDGRAALRR